MISKCSLYHQKVGQDALASLQYAEMTKSGCNAIDTSETIDVYFNKTCTGLISQESNPGLL